MKIAVCVKQVPDTVEIRIDKATGTLIRDSVPAILNPFDTYAVEEGVQIRERLGGEVIVITMGPLQASEALYEACGAGADSAVHICDRTVRGSDTFVTANVLAAAVRKLGGVDLILCGKQAVDGDTAQVGPELAELLGIPHVAYVKKIREVTKNFVLCERMVETGVEVIKAGLPAVLTVLKDINTPRLPSFKLKRKAKQNGATVWDIAALGLSEDEVGLNGSPTTVLRTFTPETKGSCHILGGSKEEQISELLTVIRSVGAATEV